LASEFSVLVGRGQARFVNALRMTAKWYETSGSASITTSGSLPELSEQRVASYNSYG
jgi:hypothetical protein